MSTKHSKHSLAAAVGGAFVVSLAASPMASAAENPFVMNELPAGYMVADKSEGKCGAGKCAGDKAKKTGEKAEKAEEKAKEGKCGAGKCAGDKAKMTGEKAENAEEKAKEGKCGAGKCAGDKK